MPVSPGHLIQTVGSGLPGLTREFSIFLRHLGTQYLASATERVPSALTGAARGAGALCARPCGQPSTVSVRGPGHQPSAGSGMCQLCVD
jgi:hypothetical protein